MLPAPVNGQLDPVDVAPGVVLRIQRSEPLPLDLDAWHARAVGGNPVITRERGTTEAGWPVTLVRVPGALFGFFELFDRGVVVAVTAQEDSALDRAFPELRELLLAGDIDREQRDIVALAQIWGDA